MNTNLCYKSMYGLLKLFLEWSSSKSIGNWSWFKAKPAVLSPPKPQSDSDDWLNESAPYSLWASDLYLIATLLATESTWTKRAMCSTFLVRIFAFFSPLQCSLGQAEQVWSSVIFSDFLYMLKSGKGEHLPVCRTAKIPWSQSSLSCIKSMVEVISNNECYMEQSWNTCQNTCFNTLSL